MAILRLWPATNGPAAVTVDSDDYTMGTEFSVSAPATVLACHFWRPANAPATAFTIALYQITGPSTGSLVQSTTGFTAPANHNGWYRAAFTTPISIDHTQTYLIAVQSTTNNFYSATAGYWTGAGAGAAGVTNGILYAPYAGDTAGNSQSRFNAGSTLGYPNATFGSTNYWIDVEVDDGVSSTPTGTAAGTFSFAGTLTGSMLAKSTGAGTFSYVGASTGTAPSLTVPSGSAAGAWSFAGASTGARASSGSASGTVTWEGSAQGPVSALSIAEENALTGRNKNLWFDGVGTEQMPAFSRSTYYEPGDTAQFSVDFNSAFTYEVIRLGHYSDVGGRRVAGPTAGTPASQPSPNVISGSNGAVDCAHWSVNVSWSIPTDAVPGWYYLFITDGSSNYGQVLFCVSDKQQKKPVLAICGDATWHAAYNGYGGNNVYGAVKWIGAAGSRALCSSYDKPVITRDYVPQTHFFNAANSAFKYLEALGVEVGYTTIEQINNDPTIMEDRDLIVFAGHNEYVPDPVLDKTKELLADGQRIVNWAANDFFWRVKLGTTSNMNTPGRVMWCKKDTLAGPSAIRSGGAGTPFTTAADWTGTWQDTRWAFREPTTGFMGDRFIANGIRNDSVKVPFSMKSSPLWRDCPGVQALTAGQEYTFPAGSLGMEWDKPEGSLSQVRLSSSTVDLENNSSDVNGEDYGQDGIWEHSITIVRSGTGLIFNFNSDQWAKTLDDFNIRHGNIANANAKQACLNMLVDLGVGVDEDMVDALSLTMPTPVSGEVGAAYGLAAAEEGTADGAWSFVGSATGTTNKTGTAAGAWSFAGASTGQSSRAGTAAGTFAYVGTTTGGAISTGSAVGSFAYVGVSTGTAPDVDHADGTATGAWGFVGANTGARSSSGAAAGMWTFFGLIQSGQRDVVVSSVDEVSRIVFIELNERSRGGVMELSRHGREYYALRITTAPEAVGWEASFDYGATWHPATQEDGLHQWLVAGAEAAQGGAVAVLSRNTAPLIRLTDNPEIVVRKPPRILVN